MDKNIHYIIELYKAYYIFNSEIQTKRWDNKETWNLKNNDLYLWIEKSPCDFLKPRVSEVSEGTFSPRNNVLLDGFVCSEILLTPMEESSARTIKRPVHRVGKLLFDEMFLFFFYQFPLWMQWLLHSNCSRRFQLLVVLKTWSEGMGIRGPQGVCVIFIFPFSHSTKLQTFRIKWLPVFSPPSPKVYAFKKIYW